MLMFLQVFPRELGRPKDKYMVYVQSDLQSPRRYFRDLETAKEFSAQAGYPVYAYSALAHVWALV